MAIHTIIQLVGAILWLSWHRLVKWFQDRRETPGGLGCVELEGLTRLYCRRGELDMVVRKRYPTEFSICIVARDPCLPEAAVVCDSVSLRHWAHVHIVMPPPPKKEIPKKISSSPCQDMQY